MAAVPQAWRFQFSADTRLVAIVLLRKPMK